MSDYKPITGELRKYATVAWDPWPDARDRLYQMCDRIDAEHERECKEQYACGAEHGIGASIDASMIQTHGYVELPKDADGEYIHLGDLLEITHGFGVTDIGEVTDIHLQDGKCAVSICFEDDSGVTAFPEDYRHHHVSTVEDVLREFALKVAGEECMTMRTGVVEEFAKRLQLAGDAS